MEAVPERELWRTKIIIHSQDASRDGRRLWDGGIFGKHMRLI
jgi:hypothetical protein